METKMIKIASRQRSPNSWSSKIKRNALIKTPRRFKRKGAMGPTPVAGRDLTGCNIVRRPNNVHGDLNERCPRLISRKVPICQLREIVVVIGAGDVRVMFLDGECWCTKEGEGGSELGPCAKSFEIVRVARVDVWAKPVNA